MKKKLVKLSLVTFIFIKVFNNLIVVKAIADSNTSKNADTDFLLAGFIITIIILVLNKWKKLR